jgi:putative Holliday junction resolvase
MARIISFDVGLKRIGVANTDPLQLIATALGTFSPAEIAPFLQKYMSTEEVESFVVGEPLQADGTPSESAHLVNQFKAWLLQQFPTIPVYMVDERYTSSMAKQSLLDSGLRKKDRRDKKLLDSVSATLILQTYLQTNSHNK